MQPRMRTASGVLDIIKAQDPDTEVTLHYIRRIIAAREVPVAQVGRKKLVNADVVIAHIAAGGAAEGDRPVMISEIRRVPV